MVSTSTVKTKREVSSKSGLICRVKYTNTLPDIPSDSKSIKYPFKRDRFIKYKPTTLEKLCKVELHTDFDLGVNIDLINPETYIRPPQADLHPDDNALLQDDDMKKSDTRRSNIHRKKHTFFRASEYISQDFKQYGVSKEKTESRIDIKEKFKDEEIYKDREAQIKAIEATFNDALEEVSDHYSKPGVHAVEVMPLLPDFDMWQHACAQVIFDTDPAPRQAKHGSAQKSHEIMSQAMIRGMQDEDNDQFVAYFLPTEATLDKRDNDRKVGLNYEEDETYDYKLTKEYNWNVKNKASKGYEENFFFCYRPGQGVFYNELETRIRLSKRVKSRDQKAQHSNTILAVQHREMDEQERLAQTMRLDALKHADPNDSDDDDSSSDDSDAADSDNSTAQTPARQPGSDEDTVQRAGGAAGGGAGSDSDSDQSDQPDQNQQKKQDSSSDDDGSDKSGSDDEKQNNPFGSDSDEADSDSD